MAQSHMTDSIDSYRRRMGDNIAGYFFGVVLIIFGFLILIKIPFLKMFGALLLICGVAIIFIGKFINRHTKRKFRY